MDSSQESHDLPRLTAMIWDASIPIAFAVNVPGYQPQTGHFLVPRMIPVHLCTKPMWEKLQSIENAKFGSDKYRSWFEYRSRFNKNKFTAIIPWSIPIVVVVDWLTALEFPNEIKPGSKDTIEKMFEDNALPLELKYVLSDSKVSDEVPVEALVQSQFLHADKQFAHKLWFSALLGSASEAAKLPPQIERTLRSWDAHTFHRGRRDLVKKAQGKESTAVVAFHIVQRITEPQTKPVSIGTSLRLVDAGADKAVSTFGQLLKSQIFQQYSKLSNDQCMSTEPLSSELGLVRVLGTNPPLYTPLAFMRDNFCARDFALHVVVRPLPNTCVSSSPLSSSGGSFASDNNFTTSFGGDTLMEKAKASMMAAAANSSPLSQSSTTSETSNKKPAAGYEQEGESSSSSSSEGGGGKKKVQEGQAAEEEVNNASMSKDPDI